MGGLWGTLDSTRHIHGYHGSDLIVRCITPVPCYPVANLAVARAGIGTCEYLQSPTSMARDHFQTKQAADHQRAHDDDIAQSAHKDGCCLQAQLPRNSTQGTSTSDVLTRFQAIMWYGHSWELPGTN